MSIKSNGTQTLIDEEYEEANQKQTNDHHEKLVKEMIVKEAKLKSLQNEKTAYIKEINHIRKSNTWKYSSKFRFFQKFMSKITRRKKIDEQTHYIHELETELEKVQKELYETRDQLRDIRLNDRMLNSNQIVDFIRTINDEGQLIEYLNKVLNEKKLHEDHYKTALRYIARLFMNEKAEYRNLIYSKILSSLKLEDIPEFMLRAGLTAENSIPLKQVASFRANLSTRLRQKQLVGSLPEFAVEDKVDAYHFIDYLNIRKPKIIEQKFTMSDMPKKDNVVIKPIDGAGSRGVYLVYDFNDIIDIHRSEQINSWEALEENIKKDLTTGRVSEDLWFMEELILEDKENKLPASDVKFYCFYGKVGVILEISRYPERKHCWWTVTGDRIRTGKYEEDLFKGKGVTKEEIELASVLSLKIPAPFIRIDFLRSENELVFGEFTAKPGNYDEFDDETDQWLGDLYLDAQGRLTDDLLNGKQFEEFKKYKEFLGYPVDENQMINM